MKNILAMLFLAFGISLLAQSPIPRLSKQSIGTSGCYAYFPADMPDFEKSLSEDGSVVFVSEVEISSDFQVGCITVQFSEPMPNEDDLWDALVENYLAYLQQQLGITAAAGLGAGHTLESNPEAQGYIDYWQDADGLDYAVKAWINDKYLALMFITGPDDELNYNFKEMYLNGFRFPDAEE